MSNNSNINGFIEGISKDSFELIRKDLEDVFENVSWNKNTIEIDSYGKHHDDVVFPVYDKIAFYIDGDGVGQLDVEGDECGDLSCIFFSSGQWRQVWVEITYPENLFNESTNITYSRTAYVHVNPSLLDAMKNELEGWANGDDNVCVARDVLKNCLDMENKKILLFLKTVQNELTGQVGDIVFHT